MFASRHTIAGVTRTLDTIGMPTYAGERASGRIHTLDWTVILAAFLGFPMAMLGEVDNVSLGTLAWVGIIFTGVLAALVVPIEPSTLRALLPFLLFFGYGTGTLVVTNDLADGMQILFQYATVAVAYVAGWRALQADRRVLGAVQRLALWMLPAALIVFAKSLLDGRFSFGWLVGDGARPMVMMLSLLFLIATIGRSRRFTLLLWAALFLVAVASGGRMGTAVLGLMLVLTPAIRVKAKTRLAMIAAGLVVLSLVIQVDAIQDRLFVGRESGELSDIVSLEGNFNTAGRAENWPRIAEACAPQGMFGNGAGSSGALTLEATAGKFDHPHNDYLRIYCEFGFVGSAFFWSFFLLVGFRGWKLFRDRRATSVESELGAVGALAVIALLVFATTDNIVTYTATFMAAAGVLWGMSDRTYHDVAGRAPWEGSRVRQGLLAESQLR
jgi:O-antigen ligase